MLSKIKIFVVQDDPSLSARLRLTTHAHGAQLELVGTEHDYSCAHQAIKRALPNVVALNKRSGLLHFLQIVHSSLPTVHSLAFVSEGDDAEALWKAGVTGLCPNDVSGDDLQSAVLCVSQGHSWIERTIVERMRHATNGHKIDANSYSKQVACGGGPAALSEREMSVLKLLANGARNREIANELYTSVSTIKSDIARILTKLGVDDRIEAAVYATRHGLI